MQPHILVADDDHEIRELLGKFLQEQGYIVSLAKDVPSCELILADFSVDLLIIDVMMPGESGIEYMKRNRTTIKCPVIMLTALGDVDDRISGLSHGANDYMAKPFEPQELLLRIKNLLSFTSSKQNNIISFGKWKYDMSKCILQHDGGLIVNLTSNEQTILKLLVAKNGQVIDRDEIINMFPGSNPRSIDTIVARLRHKIEVDSRNPIYLQTVRGQGYVLRV
jgi:two-component system phosphate regulon response regulator OmpR